MLCLPAFVNGYPLIFSDLIVYMGDGMRIVRRLWPGGTRPPFYGVAIWPVHLELSLWPVVLVQGLIVCHLLAVVLRTASLETNRARYFGIIVGLTALTSLPWYVSHVMPDIFGGILVLSMFLLGYRSSELSRFERVYFLVLATGSLLVHVSFFPVGIAILLMVVLLARFRTAGWQRARPLLLAVPLGAALCISSYVSHRFWGNFSGPPYPPPYLLANVLANGPGKEYLRSACPAKHYVLCDHLDLIPDDVEGFMFRSYSPFSVLGRSKQIRAESMDIIVGTAAAFPLRTAMAAFGDGVKQLFAVSTEVAQLDDLPDGRGGSLADVLTRSYPFIGAAYKNTMQDRGELDDDHLRPINVLDQLVLVASVIYIAFVTKRAAATRDWISVQLISVAIVGIVVNAFVAGAAVGVFDRFGARVIWLLPFVAIVCFVASKKKQPSTDVTPTLQ